MSNKTANDIKRQSDLEAWAQLSPLVMVIVLCVGAAIGFHGGVQFDRSDAIRHGLGLYHADPQTGETRFYWVVGGGQ